MVTVEGKQLILYLDRFASNEPVVKARVEVEGAGVKGVASEIAPGTYALELTAALPAARHPLTISVEAGDAVDLLAATLDTSPQGAVAPHVHDRSEWLAWGIAGLLLLAGGALWAVRRHRKARGIRT